MEKGQGIIWLGSEGCVGVCQVEAGKWGAVDGIQAARWGSLVLVGGKLQLCLPLAWRGRDESGTAAPPAVKTTRGSQHVPGFPLGSNPEL